MHPCPRHTARKAPQSLRLVAVVVAAAEEVVVVAVVQKQLLEALLLLTVALGPRVVLDLTMMLVLLEPLRAL